MADSKEKSTGDPNRAASVRIHPEVVLDGRLALFHEKDKWLALSDLHFGYEVSRRRDGGLWPMWGMDVIEKRLRELVSDWQPRQVILVGDVVDGRAAPDRAIPWLREVEDFCEELILVKGNHDCGRIIEEFDFVPSFECGEFFFQHGHEEYFEEERADDRGLIEICGHLHPSHRFNDGAGTSMKMPTFAIEKRPDRKSDRWILPAFSPWAAGGKFEQKTAGSEVKQWACSAQRVIPVE